ncbi:MAG: hypothetical protein ABFD76_15345 [Smithella sp.]
MKKFILVFLIFTLFGCATTMNITKQEKRELLMRGSLIGVQCDHDKVINIQDGKFTSDEIANLKINCIKIAIERELSND